MIALIPARGGSKRLARKNILPINDVPIIEHVINTALESRLFTEVVVSTDDQEIAQISKNAGAKIIDRPKKHAKDTSKVVDVCIHALSFYKNLEAFCCIYPTACLINASDLIGANYLLQDDKVDYVMGVSKYNFSPLQALKKEGNYLQSLWPKYNSIQSQRYPDLFVSNGSFYFAKVASFIKEKSFYGNRLMGYEVNNIDVNTEDDYQRLKSKMLKTSS